MEKKKLTKEQNKEKYLRIIDKHNRPKKRLKGVKDVRPFDAIVSLWENPNIKISYPKETIIGWDLDYLINKLAQPNNITKY